MEIKDGSKDADGKSSRKSRSALEIFPKNVKLHTVLHNLEGLATNLKHRRLLADSSKQERGKNQAYITYRSCIPPVSEEKLSVLGFEVCFSSLDSSLLLSHMLGENHTSLEVELCQTLKYM